MGFDWDDLSDTFGLDSDVLQFGAGAALIGADPLSVSLQMGTYEINSDIKEAIQTAADPLDEVLDQFMQMYLETSRSLYDIPNTIANTETEAFNAARASEQLSGMRVNRQTSMFGGI